MNVVDIIRKKRDCQSLTSEEIEFVVSNYTKKKIPDYQLSAFLMAIYLNGMNERETASLTKTMLYSGKVIDLSHISGPKVDKHSTGGVGDKTSLIIAPIAAAAGVKMPMISGRGLGHSGGTLDKLESIPGFKINLSLKEYKNALKKCGAVLIGQTKDIAPADKLLYALRDVTATVESIPLITASIMSKKLAEGSDGLVLDVKTGSGAFMKKQKDAELLAYSLMKTARMFDKDVIAFITDMNQPLGHYIGNWLEVYESIKILQGEKVEDLLTVSLNLAGAMIYLGNKASDLNEGIEIARSLIDNGRAFDKFIQIIKTQGGNISLIKNPGNYPKPKIVESIVSDKTGYLTNINTFNIGMAAVELGAGRKTKEDKIDPIAGIIFNAKLGEKIKWGQVIAELHTSSERNIQPAKELILASLKISKQSSYKHKLIKKIIF